MIVEGLRWNRLLTVSADNGTAWAGFPMTFRVLAIELQLAPLALLFGVSLLHMFIQVVDVDHLGAQLTTANVAAAI